MRNFVLLGLFMAILMPFSIAQALDQSAPLINSVNVIEVTKASAKIVWTTDEPATTEVVYGDGRFSSAELATKHTVVLEGLKPATLYYFNVTSCDAASNCATASGKSLKFSTTGYLESNPIVEQSNFSKSVLTSVTKIHVLNFTEQNPIRMSIDSREGFFFKYDGSEYAMIFPQQSASNTTVRLLPRTIVDMLVYGDDLEYDLTNDSESDIYLKISSAKRTDVPTQDPNIKYVRYQFSILMEDLNSPEINKTEEAGIKFEQNPVYESKYEPPVKEGSIGISGSALEDRKASVLTGIIMAAIVFVAALFMFSLAKRQE